MKSSFYFCLCALIALFSCSQESAERECDSCSMEVNERSPEKFELVQVDGRACRIPTLSQPLQTLVDKYIIFEDEKYYLTITKPEAIRMGVTEEEYEQVYSSIEGANKILKEQINQIRSAPTTNRLEVIHGGRVVYSIGREIAPTGK